MDQTKGRGSSDYSVREWEHEGCSDVADVLWNRLVPCCMVIIMGAPAQPNRQLTGSLLGLFPPNLSPSTTSALLTELSKPLSANDEPGYIYM